MADLSKIKLNGIEYTLKDAIARELIEQLSESGTSYDAELAARITALEELEWATYYSGRTAPSDSQGQNGDIYLQY